MPLQELLALALASGVASGLNVYACVAILGLIQRAGWVTLPAPMDTLSHPWVILAALLLYLIEFVADKIPYFDSVWDAVHTFIRVPIGALLAAGMFSQFPAHWQVIMAMAGGFLALQAHGTKATLRLAANTSPEPFTNWALSFTEDVVAAGLMWFAARHPYLALYLVLAITVASFFFLRAIFQTLGRLWKRFFATEAPRTPRPI